MSSQEWHQDYTCQFFLDSWGCTPKLCPLKCGVEFCWKKLIVFVIILDVCTKTTFTRCLLHSPDLLHPFSQNKIHVEGSSLWCTGDPAHITELQGNRMRYNILYKTCCAWRDDPERAEQIHLNKVSFYSNCYYYNYFLSYWPDSRILWIEMWQHLQPNLISWFQPIKSEYKKCL